MVERGLLHCGEEDQSIMTAGVENIPSRSTGGERCPGQAAGPVQEFSAQTPQRIHALRARDNKERKAVEAILEGTSDSVDGGNPSLLQKMFVVISVVEDDVDDPTTRVVTKMQRGFCDPARMEDFNDFLFEIYVTGE